jgi:hypothetical protein
MMELQSHQHASGVSRWREYIRGREALSPPVRQLKEEEDIDDYN